MIKILIVEDEKPIADLLDMSLTAAGYHCDCVDNGLAAADAVEEVRYDLILLDVMQPVADLIDGGDPLLPAQLFPQALDMQVHGAAVAHVVVFPHPLIDGLRADGLLRPPEYSRHLYHRPGLCEGPDQGPEAGGVK